LPIPFHQRLHTHHLSSGAGTICQLVADVQSGLKSHPTQETKTNELNYTRPYNLKERTPQKTPISFHRSFPVKNELFHLAEFLSWLLCETYSLWKISDYTRLLEQAKNISDCTWLLEQAKTSVTTRDPLSKRKTFLTARDSLSKGKTFLTARDSLSKRKTSLIARDSLSKQKTSLTERDPLSKRKTSLTESDPFSKQRDGKNISCVHRGIRYGASDSHGKVKLFLCLTN
jgi:hypothetical protein